MTKCACDVAAESGVPIALDHVAPVSDMLNLPPTPIQWLVDGLFPAGYVLMIHSPEGVGKTILSFNLALSVASGTKFLGLKTVKGLVLYLDEENPDTYVHDSLSQMCRARKIDPESLRNTFLMGRFSLSGKKPEIWCKQLRATVEATKPALVVLDTFSCILPAIENVENDAAIMKSMLRYLRIAKIDSPETTMMILHHPPRNADRPRGSGVIGQDVDGYYSLKRPRGRPGQSQLGKATILVPGKARRLAGVPSYSVTPVTGKDTYDLKGTILIDKK